MDAGEEDAVFLLQLTRYMGVLTMCVATRLVYTSAPMTAVLSAFSTAKICSGRTRRALCCCIWRTSASVLARWKTAKKFGTFHGSWELVVSVATANSSVRSTIGMLCCGCPRSLCSSGSVPSAHRIMS